MINYKYSNSMSDMPSVTTTKTDRKPKKRYTYIKIIFNKYVSVNKACSLVHYSQILHSKKQSGSSVIQSRIKHYSSVIFVLIYYLVSVLVLEIFFRFSFVLVFNNF